MELSLNLVNNYEVQESINFNDEMLKQYSRYLQVNDMSKRNNVIMIWSIAIVNCLLYGEKTMFLTAGNHIV